MRVTNFIGERRTNVIRIPLQSNEEFYFTSKRRPKKILKKEIETKDFKPILWTYTSKKTVNKTNHKRLEGPRRQTTVFNLTPSIISDKEDDNEDKKREKKTIRLTHIQCANHQQSVENL